MNGEQFIELFKGEADIGAHKAEIERLSADYPWFVPLKVLLVRHYSIEGDRDAESEVRRSFLTALHGLTYHSVLEKCVVKDRQIDYSDVVDAYIVGEAGDDAAEDGHGAALGGDECVKDRDVKADRFQQQDTAEKSRTQTSETLTNDDVIRRFLNKNPGPIRPDDTAHPQADTTSSEQIGDEVVSESLAGIYAAQGLNDEAIRLYRKLCLKYPEKSAYFATRIVELGGVPDEPTHGHISDDRIFESDGVRVEKLDGCGDADGDAAIDGATADNPLGLVWDDLEPVRFDSKEK